MRRINSMGAHPAPPIIDGSGVTDIIYLKNDGIDLYFNSAACWMRRAGRRFFPMSTICRQLTVVICSQRDCLHCLVIPTARQYATTDALSPVNGAEAASTIGDKEQYGGGTHVQYGHRQKLPADKAAAKHGSRGCLSRSVVIRVETLDRISRTASSQPLCISSGFIAVFDASFAIGMVEQSIPKNLPTLSASEPFRKRPISIRRRTFHRC